MIEHLDHLRAFVSAAESGSFSAAARNLGRAQSVVSTHIALLETDLGLALFDRSARNPVLTEPGRALLNEAREVLRQCGQLEARALSLCRDPQAELRLALDDGLPYGDLTQLCIKLTAAFPHLKVQFLYGATLEVRRWVAEGDAHMGVGYGDPTVEVSGTFSGVERQWVGSMEQVLVAAPSHPLCALQTVTRRDLARHRQIILRCAQEPGHSALVFSPMIWETNSAYAAADLVMLGLGWCILPVTMTTYEGVVSGLRVLQPEMGFPTLNMQILTRSEQPLTAVTRWVCAEFKTMWCRKQ